MKDGLYLSTYLNPLGPHRLYNVWLRHDNNISLWRKTGSRVDLLQHWEFERITGQKDHRTPFFDPEDARDFIDELLQPLGLSLRDMVEIWGTPGLATVDDYHLVQEFPDIAFHSLSHLYSAMLLDSNDFFGGDILGLAVDRGPDYVLDVHDKPHWFAGGFSRRGKMEVFPVESPGPLYFEARFRFGLREGTLMALATATNAQGKCDREPLLASYRFDGTPCFAQARSLLNEVVAQVESSLTRDPRFSEDENIASAVMKEVQALSVMIMEKNVDRVIDQYGIALGETTLALAGGYALNCPTNSHLMKKYGFRKFTAPPCVGDSGQSIGIALAAFHKKMGRLPFSFFFSGAYLGREDPGLDKAVSAYSEFIESIDDFDESIAVDDIRTAPVVWFDGRSEIGPRALGDRSLIGDPTSRRHKDTLNVLKRRQWWRPVAPVVLEEHTEDWFEDARKSPYMLETFAIREGKRELIPAVAHLDYSARVQTLSREENPALHRLIEAFYERTSVPMLCNTSLNDKGEPIIDTIAEAINFCLRRGVRVAYFNGKRVLFKERPDYELDMPLPRSHKYFSQITEERAAELRRRYNPHGLPDLYVYFCLRDPVLTSQFDISSPEGAAALTALIDKRFQDNPGEEDRVVNGMKRSGRYFSVYGREVDS